MNYTSQSLPDSVHCTSVAVSIKYRLSQRQRQEKPTTCTVSVMQKNLIEVPSADKTIQNRKAYETIQNQRASYTIQMERHLELSKIENIENYQN